MACGKKFVAGCPSLTTSAGSRANWGYKYACDATELIRIDLQGVVFEGALVRAACKPIVSGYGYYGEGV